LWPLEDKRLLVLKDAVAVVVGYEHPPGCFVAYLKYVYGKGPWRGYERTVKEYSPEAVVWSRSVYDPNFNTTVPLVCEDEVLDAPDPLARADEIVSSPKGDLEEKVLELLLRLEGRAGVGGSILLKMAHARSDIDILIYEDKDPLSVWEALKDSSYLEEEKQWVYNVARRTSLPVSIVSKLYSKSMRAVYKGTAVSFSFVRRRFERYGASAAQVIGTYLGELELDGDPREALYYPHRRTAGGVVLESYESAFTKPMIECDEVKVKGLLFMRPDGTKVIRVGTKELMGYVLPARSCRL